MFSLVVAGLLPLAAAQTAPAPTWIRTLDPGGLDLGEGVAVDAEGNVYVTGIAEVAGQQDVVTAKLAPDSSVLWVRSVDQGAADRGEDVAVAPDGGAIVVGSIGSPGGDDVIVTKYSSDGEALWTTTFDKGTSEAARGVAVAPDGSVFVTGASLSMNGGDGFLAKLDPDGKEMWARPINLFYFEETFDVDVDGAGGAVVVGRVLRETDFDVIVRKFTSDGRVAWTQFVSSPAREEARGVASTPEGGAYVIGTQQVESGGAMGGDLLLAHFAPDGQLAWTRTFDIAGGDDAGRDIALDPSGNLLVTGFGATEGAKDAALFKLTPDGGEIWRVLHEAGGIGGTGAVALGPNGRTLIAGAQQVAGADFTYLLLAFDEPPPSAGFVARVGATPTSYHFEDASAPGSSRLIAWHWEFGDGESADVQNPSHTYAWGGSRDVELTVTDAAGNRATSVRTLAVDGPSPPDPSSSGAAAAVVDGPAGGGPAAPEESSTPSPTVALVALAGLVAALARRRAPRSR